MSVCLLYDFRVFYILYARPKKHKSSFIIQAQPSRGTIRDKAVRIHKCPWVSCPPSWSVVFFFFRYDHSHRRKSSKISEIMSTPERAPDHDARDRLREPIGVREVLEIVGGEVMEEIPYMKRATEVWKKMNEVSVRTLFTKKKLTLTVLRTRRPIERQPSLCDRPQMTFCWQFAPGKHLMVSLRRGISSLGTFSGMYNEVLRLTKAF